MSETKFVRVEHRGHVSTVTIDRPDRLNALGAEVLRDLTSALAEIRDRPETRCAILTGAGRAFVAGADISEMEKMTSAEARAMVDAGQALFASIEALRFPVIAAVNGFALGGGCELALACDFVLASSKAKFGLPEVSLGIVPGFGGTQRLARRVGVGVAREWVYTGRASDAAEALRVGLVNRVIEPEALLEEANKVADEIATRGPVAVAAAKRVVLNGVDRDLSAGCVLEAEAFESLFDTADRKEGMTAFMAKRAPTFVGR